MARKLWFSRTFAGYLHKSVGLIMYLMTRCDNFHVITRDMAQQKKKERGGIEEREKRKKRRQGEGKRGRKGREHPKVVVKRKRIVQTLFKVTIILT